MATAAEKRQKGKETADGEWVVLHDMVSYPDPDHDPAPGQPRALLFAARGEVLGDENHVPPTNAEVARLEKLGAITSDKDTIDAKLALAGQRPQSTQLPPPYISLTSPAEQVRAAQAAGRYPGGVSVSSNKRDLARLSIGDLKVMAVAFGHPELAESDSPDEIINVLTGGDGNAPSRDEIDQQRQARDERQVAAREIAVAQREPGLVGSDVTSAGVRASTGERTAEPDESKEARAARDQAQSEAVAEREAAAREGGGTGGRAAGGRRASRAGRGGSKKT